MATGGSQRVLLLQASWFLKRGYSVAVAFLYDKEHLLPVWCAEYDVPIYDLGFAPPTDNLLVQAVFFVRGVYRLFRLLKVSPCTAIVTFAHHATLIGLPLAWLAGVPNRIASHRGKIEGISRLLERLHAMVINSPLADCLVVVAERVRDDAIAEGVRPERIVKIANGVVLPGIESADSGRLRDRLGLGQDVPVLLSVGRLRHQKAHSILLKAFPAVLAKFPAARMLIAGDGVLRAELEAEAASLEIANRVTFLGVRHDVAALLSLANLFVFPSRFEGMPNAVLEAMSQGLPVIATAVQGVDEIIRDGQNGLLVPLEDPQALSNAILRLLRDPAERRRLGNAARKTIEQGYTVDIMCRRYEALLTADGRMQL
jgi:glycosyltransferase involved in cell wall biosynthesis